MPLYKQFLFPLAVAVLATGAQVSASEIDIEAGDVRISIDGNSSTIDTGNTRVGSPTPPSHRRLPAPLGTRPLKPPVILPCTGNEVSTIRQSTRVNRSGQYSRQSSSIRTICR
ncbi:hypothetical protein KR51_00023000 [Rubidibacter lacunae KORDI 51-2]|uniref:Uncharacterized protein n=1 Tax=Rubidibacter lacunae KORDI 51-2 TaxID=582515 RepID=U5D8X1_9CHRO|nr:hypothetical protein KR51_00023000 [Rubidibacter lacunae KORDI 51-2]